MKDPLATHIDIYTVYATIPQLRLLSTEPRADGNTDVWYCLRVSGKRRVNYIQRPQNLALTLWVYWPRIASTRRR